MNLTTPIFSNTCGKLFADKVILASAHHERAIETKKIAGAKFSSRPEPKSLFFVALPLLLFAFPFLTHPDEVFIKALFIILGAVFLTVSIIKMDRRHTLSIKLVGGKSINIKVWQENRKDAKKFAERINSILRSR